MMGRGGEVCLWYRLGFLWALGLAGCDTGESDPYQVCGQSFLVSEQECTVGESLSGGLPDGLWLGVKEQTDPAGQGSCAEVRVMIENNELWVDTIFPDIQSLSFEQWLFDENGVVDVVDHNGEGLGGCDCVAFTCWCTYGGDVEGAMRLEFRGDLLIRSDTFHLAGSDSAYTSYGVARQSCDGSFEF